MTVAVARYKGRHQPLINLPLSACEGMLQEFNTSGRKGWLVIVRMTVRNESSEIKSSKEIRGAASKKDTEYCAI
jgi:hypothetical protein